MKTKIKNWKVNSVKKIIHSINAPIKTSIFTMLMILSVPLSAATYKLTFTGVWNGSHIQSNSLPDNSHLTTLVGATHQSGQPLWMPNTLASLGVQNVAEQGNTSEIMNEINAAILSGTAHSEIITDALFTFPSSSSVTFEVFDSHSHVSLVSMIAPSPDWFVGVYDVSLKQDGNWVETLSIDLTPWDAGTKEGDDFDFGFPATNPHELISKISGTPFVGSPVIGNLTFERIDSEPPVNNEPAICETGVDPQVIKLNEGTALWWWSDNAISGSMDNGIGQITVPSDWVWIYPTETTTFTMNVTAPNGTKSLCETTLIVEGEANPEPPLCTIGSDPEVINAGEGTALWWWTRDAASASVDNGIGDVTLPSNYNWIYPSQTTTYTINTMGADGSSITCNTTVIVR